MLVQLDLQVQLVQQDHKVSRAILDLQELQDPQVQQAQQVLLALMVQQVLLGLLV
jgi:hypothetical protein